MSRLPLALAATVATLSLAACGDDDPAATSAGSTPAAAVTTTASASSGAYTAVSDVTAHAAIGKDLGSIRALLEPAAEGGDADFAGAARIFTGGRHSKKGDGTMRTLAGFVEGTDLAQRIGDALAGTGQAADLDPAQRRQWADKGLLAALRAKILDELDAAAEKVAAGETDPEEGAPHNVDEAWAFFEAEGEGIATTAKKRAADFGLDENELSGAVLTALGDAQQAASAGDARALKAAREATRGALNRIFALAVKKYAGKAGDDAVAREEGRAFAWALEDDLRAGARTAIAGAFAADADTTAVEAAIAALDEQASALGFDGPLPALREG